MHRGRVSIAVDGKRIWDEEADFFAADASEFAIGWNSIGGSSCGPRFTGDLLSVERVRRE